MPKAASAQMHFIPWAEVPRIPSSRWYFARVIMWHRAVFDTIVTVGRSSSPPASLRSVIATGLVPIFIAALI
jgi:hypothetical protein